MSMDRRSFVGVLAGAAALPILNLDSLADTLLNADSPSALAVDPRRPQYHLLPPANWMNDPNAPIYWHGSYHMFYQYNPEGAYWGDMHWGHATSLDMVHWKHHPIALSPTPEGPDADGCFTGTAAVLDGRVVVLYTGVHAVPPAEATIKDGAHSLRETQCLAIANDPDLEIWTKLPTPVIPSPPPGLEVNGFRDPSPWKQGDWWYTVLGSGLADKGGAVLLYRSRDLRSWEFMHILASREGNGAGRFDPFDPWEVWECPDFFPLGDRHVLIYSTNGKAYWQSGKLDVVSMTFHPDETGILDYGSFYAPKTQLDGAGKRIVWGWIQETRPLAEYKVAGWAGLMSLPRVLSLSHSGRIKIAVANEVDQLRGREQVLNLATDEDSVRRQISSIRVEACCGEILCTVQRSSDPFDLVFSSPAGSSAPWLTLAFDPGNREQVLIDARPVPLTLSEQDDLEFHLYVDGSVIEVFVNGQIAWTKRFYYSGNKPQDFQMKWTGNTTMINSLSVWQLSPISHDRLTT